MDETQMDETWAKLDATWAEIDEIRISVTGAG